MNILETAAHTHSPYLHPGGETMTRVLIEKLALKPGKLVLEMGCGTGATAMQVAAITRARVVAFDQLASMLAVAESRFRRGGTPHTVSLLAANADAPFPFQDAVFDAVYAESVLALTRVPPVFREIVRILHPGGKLILNERIWKPDVTAEEAAHINHLSQKYFGIPAATAHPWNRKDWLALLREAGFVDLNAALVENFVPANHQRHLRLPQRLTHFRQHLTHPATYIRNLQFRFLGKRYKKIWGRMEAVLFIGRKADG